MNFTIIYIGKKNSIHDEAIREYVKRFKKPFSLFFESGSPAGIDDREQSRKLETEKLVSKISKHTSSAQKSCKVYLLDENGKDYSTEKLADKLGSFQSEGISDCLFVIGGSYGFDVDELKQVASGSEVIKLSSLTLPHELVRLLLVEQLYRCTDLLSGGKYHHE
jgi:23S rRNA (pseudouridine1915-N3)-methyltransferase